MEKIHELLAYERIKIIQREDMLRFSLDSTLLSSFVNTTLNPKMIVDLGCGNAPIPLFLSIKTKALIYGIEIQKEVFDLGVRSVKLNNLENQIVLINDDIKGINKKIGNSFDIVITNPPYFKYTETSNTNKNDYLTIARHEVLITLDEIVKEANLLLKDGAYFYMVHRPERLPDIMLSLKNNNFGLRKMRFIYSSENDGKAILVLIEARKNKASDVIVEKPLYIYDAFNKYTKEVTNIFNTR